MHAVRALTPDDAASALSVIRTAFSAQEVATDPPSGALDETEQTIAQAIEHGGACIARDGAIVAVVLWHEREGSLYLGRLAVLPSARRCGMASALIGAAGAEAIRRGLDRLLLGTRLNLAGNRRLFASLGFREVGFATHAGYTAPTSVDMAKQL